MCIWTLESSSAQQESQRLGFPAPQRFISCGILGKYLATQSLSFPLHKMKIIIPTS